MGNESVVGNWKTRMGSSYDAWKADFDTYCNARSTHDNATPKREFACFRAANNMIYHSAHIILNADFLDLQIYAGARHILGHSVNRADYIRSQRVVKQWAGDNTQSAAKAASHAAHLLQESLLHLEDFDQMGLFHFPWCLYLATLTCWAFHHARPAQSHGRSMEDAHGHDEDEIVWDAKAEMKMLVGDMVNTSVESLAGLRGKRRTSGLIAVVANHLSKVRWAVVQDGKTVLKGLVPWRLISQYESFS